MPGKRGRPPNPDSRRSADLHVRLRPEEFDRIYLAAKEARMSMAEYMRRQVRELAANPPRRPDER
jgi:hypothetical protein